MTTPRKKRPHATVRDKALQGALSLLLAVRDAEAKKGDVPLASRALQLDDACARLKRALVHEDTAEALRAFADLGGLSLASLEFLEARPGKDARRVTVED